MTRKSEFELADQNAINDPSLGPYIDRVLEAVGHPEALATDESMISDFLELGGGPHRVRRGRHGPWKERPGDPQVKDRNDALLAERAVATVRGNHDRWQLDASKGEGGGEWSLTKASRRFLEGTVRSWSLEREGVRVEVHHARPGSDMDGIIPPDAPRHRLELDAPRPAINASALLRDADVLVVGHTHLAFAMRFGLRFIVNPGALLRDPAEGADNPPATGTFGVLELPERRWRVYRARDGIEVEILRTP